MTIKEASRRFCIEEKEVRKRYRDGMIPNAYKDGKYIVIPEETEIIPSKEDVKTFLLQIIKFRNNEKHIFSRGICPNLDTLNALLSYLYKRGMIGYYDKDLTEEKLLTSIQLTDIGFSYVFGEKVYGKLNRNVVVPLTINIASIVL